MKRHKVLVGCETSGIVREAFRNRGHDAWSNDLLAADDSSKYHIKIDVKKAIVLEDWDIIILHPPCTALCVTGNRWYGKGMSKHKERLKAIEWTIDLYYLALKHTNKLVMENPVGVLPLKPTQYIQPWQFGHGETKKTGLWLHGLPKLIPTNLVDGREQRVWKLSPSKDRWKLRSKTYQGIADAMAEQYI